MDKYTHFIKKSIIPILLVFLGVYLLLLGYKDIENHDEPQGSSFTYGAFCSLLMGILVLIINFELINSKILKKITLPISLIILLPFAGHLSYSIYDSINTTIEEMDQKKKYDSHIQQALNDIKDIQVEYKKVYGWYSDDYNELKRFLLEDKAKLISNEVFIPKSIKDKAKLKSELAIDKTDQDSIYHDVIIKHKDSIYHLMDLPISSEHQLILKYDSTETDDWKKIRDGYSEEEALKCKLLIKDTILTDIVEKLFPKDQDEKDRAFPFNIDAFQYAPTFPFHNNEKAEFLLTSDVYKNSENKYYFLYFNDSTNSFTSSHLINFNKSFDHLYNKKGLILLQDSILGDKNLKKGDFLVSLNDTSLANPSDIRNLLSESTLKDTLTFQFIRYKWDSTTKKSLEVKVVTLNTDLASFSVNRTQNMNYWINDLETSFSAIIYNPKDYTLIPVETKFISKSDEPNIDGSNMFIDTANINKLANYRERFNQVSYEYEKGKLYTNKDSISINIFMFSKAGSPVFLAKEPKPYDPFKECPVAWKIGSLKEIKTDGNW